MAAVRVAVLGGTGRWGGNIVRTLEHLPGARLAWTAGRAGDWARRLDGERPDAVAIATPAALHAAMALACLERDLPVFVEKPMATSVADAEAIRDAADRRGLPVVVDDVTPLWDWGPHDVALAIDLAGGPPDGVIGGTDAEGNDRIELTFRNGLTWRARVGSRFAVKTRRVTVRGDRAEAVWDDLDRDKVRIAGRRVPVAGDPPLAVALSEFIRAVADRRADPPCSGAGLGVEVVRVLAGL
jgi:predicted dehydrogenase